MATHKPMQDELVATLKEIKTASGLIDTVLTANQLQTEEPDQDQIEGIKKKMLQANWRLETVNLIDGVIAGEPIKLEVSMTAALDLKTLFENIDVMKSYDTSTIEQTVARLKGQPQGEELAQVLMASILPRAYGLTSVLNRENFVEMIADEGLVHFNYAHIFNSVLPPMVTLDRELFQQKCWVNLEFLRGEAAFEKSFYYQDESNGQPLSVTVKAVFSPI